MKRKFTVWFTVGTSVEVDVTEDQYDNDDKLCYILAEAGIKKAIKQLQEDGIADYLEDWEEDEIDNWQSKT